MPEGSVKVSPSTLVEEKASLLFPRGTREVHWCSQIPALRDVECARTLFVGVVSADGPRRGSDLKGPNR